MLTNEANNTKHLCFLDKCGSFFISKFSENSRIRHAKGILAGNDGYFREENRLNSPQNKTLSRNKKNELF